MINTPKELSAALQYTGGEVEVTQSLYWHYLEVLPPKDIGVNFFVFQEGDGELLYFSQSCSKFYCHLLSDYLVTDDWKVHARVSRKEVDKPFKVLFIFDNDETCDTPEKFEDFVGKEFVSISALAEAMNVTFRV